VTSSGGAGDDGRRPRLVLLSPVDSPSVFASLLDAERGGFYQVAPDRDSSQLDQGG
jgi:hypothetical protein